MPRRSDAHSGSWHGLHGGFEDLYRFVYPRARAGMVWTDEGHFPDPGALMLVVARDACVVSAFCFLCCFRCEYEGKILLPVVSGDKAQDLVFLLAGADVHDVALDLLSLVDGLGKSAGMDKGWAAGPFLDLNALDLERVGCLLGGSVRGLAVGRLGAAACSSEGCVIGWLVSAVPTPRMLPVAVPGIPPALLVFCVLRVVVGRNEALGVLLLLQLLWWWLLLPGHGGVASEVSVLAQRAEDGIGHLAVSVPLLLAVPQGVFQKPGRACCHRCCILAVILSYVLWDGWLVLQLCKTVQIASASDWGCSAPPPPPARKQRSCTASGVCSLGCGVCLLGAWFEPR